MVLCHVGVVVALMVADTYALQGLQRRSFAQILLPTKTKFMDLGPLQFVPLGNANCKLPRVR